ncbi:G2/mitotic-specific cyclin-2-like [Trifolium pratense]|uniref:G2/mitotic-specific cyclin-2-like n=1 Tax=Trifolium pratense TaxID=57577 RepID=UPI001E695726|nr:G2/mitotic-specific cyclin-2-like [Trifolium pratense]
MDQKCVGGGRIVGKNNRRTLSVINQNLVQGRPYPCVVNKRVLTSDKHEICEKKLADLGHRPITRRFAAKIAGSQQFYVEKTKNSNPLNSNEFGNAIAIDDEHKSPTYQPIPATDPHEMEEVEMEDIDGEMILDIDSCDANNSLAVVEYIEDLHSYYRQIEVPFC